MFRKEFDSAFVQLLNKMHHFSKLIFIHVALQYRSSVLFSIPISLTDPYIMQKTLSTNNK
jgi:hypothetical protein